jgi:sec-independent protein translocase protein TatA
MVGLDNPLHIALVLVVVLLLFGAKRLPEMGRSLGEGLRGFKDSMQGTTSEFKDSLQETRTGFTDSLHGETADDEAAVIPLLSAATEEPAPAQARAPVATGDNAPPAA